MKKTIKLLVIIALALAIVFGGTLLWERPEIQNLIGGKLITVTTANPADADKSTEQLAYESAIGGTDTGLVGFSPFGKRISNQFARRENVPHFRSDVFRGFSGTFNSVGEVRAAVRTENSTAWKKAFELMIGQKCPASLDANTQAEQALGDSRPWLMIHVNACQRGDEEIRRHLEKLDGVPEGTYDTLPLVKYRTHWVTRIVEVTETEYNSADNFRGWSPTAPAGTYHAKYAVQGGRFFILEIFEDETKWARLVVHTYDDPTAWSGYSVGGVRHDDLSIVLPKEPCQGSSAPAPTPTETPTPTLEPKPADPAQYVHPAGKPTATTPDEPPAATEPPSATAVPVTAPPAKPTAKPTAVPVVVETEVIVIDNPPAPEPHPIEPPSVEPSVNQVPDGNGWSADPDGN